jgi:hypothetical protein
VVDRWKRDIRAIARQEMAHFVTVQNLLISIRAKVYVNRENNFSEHPDQYPFPVELERFGLDPLARYVATEGSILDQIPNQETRELLRKQFLLMFQRPIQTGIQAIFLGHREMRSRQLPFCCPTRPGGTGAFWRQNHPIR